MSYFDYRYNPDISDSEMIPYREFRPTGYDPRGKAATTMGHDEDDPDRSDWLVVPVSRTRDSGSRANSNYRVLVKTLEGVDPNGKDHEEHRFGHWGPGWFEIIVVRPGTAAHQAAWEAECALASYPLLSDEDHGILQAEWHDAGTCEGDCQLCEMQDDGEDEDEEYEDDDEDYEEDYD